MVGETNGSSRLIRRIVLLACAAAMLAMGVATASASAAPVWEAGGVPLTGSEEATTVGTLELTDTGGFAGATVKCEGEFHGTVGPGSMDEITSVTGRGGALPPIKCTVVKEDLFKQCKIGATAEVTAVNLPWKTTLVEAAPGEIRDLFEGNPGYEVKCGGLTDKCTGETSAGITPLTSPVPGVFDEKSPNGNCEIGGAGTGRIRGSGTTQNKTGNLEVS